VAAFLLALQKNTTIAAESENLKINEINPRANCTMQFET
jgi:hypothetical protein